MDKLLVFNPSNDMALAANSVSYTPPKNIQRYEAEMASFPEEWADEGDVVLTNWNTSYSELVRNHGRALQPSPWGWSIAIKRKFQRLGVPESLMPTDEQLVQWRQFSSREFASDYLKELLKDFQDNPLKTRLVGNENRFIKNFNQWETQGYPQICKLPWSSSGRGVFLVPPGAFPETKICGALNRQGGLSVDKFYDKAQDFAFEFEISSEKGCQFLGYSVFQATKGGKYGENLLASQSELRRTILSALPFPENEQLLQQLLECHLRLLQMRLGGKYSGYVGIDMLVADEGGRRMVHPCVEINLRMNMGIVAILKYRKAHPEGD